MVVKLQTICGFDSQVEFRKGETLTPECSRRFHRRRHGYTAIKQKLIYRLTLMKIKASKERSNLQRRPISHPSATSDPGQEPRNWPAPTPASPRRSAHQLRTNAEACRDTKNNVLV